MNNVMECQIDKASKVVTSSSSSTDAPGTKAIIALITKVQFDLLTTLAASKAKLLYYDFLTAAQKFPKFCNARLGPKISSRTKAEQCKKELAALLTEWIANTNKADSTLAT